MRVGAEIDAVVQRRGEMGIADIGLQAGVFGPDRDGDAAAPPGPSTCPVVELQRLAVHPRIRRVGLGRRLVRFVERWAREGRIAKVNFTHLMFIIWSVTQAYAEQEAQFALLLGKPALTERDYEKAEELIVRMVLSALSPDAVG